jgi:hypothetical protein
MNRSIPSSSAESSILWMERNGIDWEYVLVIYTMALEGEFTT